MHAHNSNTHLNGAHARDGPQIGVRYAGVLRLHALEALSSHVQPSIGAVATLRRKALQDGKRVGVGNELSNRWSRIQKTRE